MRQQSAIAAVLAMLAILGARLASASPILISTTTDLGNGLFAYDLVLDGQDDEYRSFFAQEFTFTGDLHGFSTWFDPTDSMASYVHAPWTGNPMGAPVQSPGSYKFSAGTGGGSKYLSLPVARVVVAGDLTVTGGIGRDGILYELEGSFSSTQSYSTIESVHNVPDWMKNRTDPVVPPEPEVVLPVELIDPPSAPEPPPEQSSEPELVPNPQAPEPPPVSDPPPTPEQPTAPGFVVDPIIGPSQPVPLLPWVDGQHFILNPDSPFFWSPNPAIYLGDLTIDDVPNLPTEETFNKGIQFHGDTPRVDALFTTSFGSPVMGNRSSTNLAAPEPATWLLAAVGAASLFLVRRRLSA